MKILVTILLSFPVLSYATGFKYECQIRDWSQQDPKDSLLALDAQNGQVQNSLILASGKQKVQVEWYFQNIQIHLIDTQTSSVIFSTTAPESTSKLKTDLAGVVSVTCLRK